MAARRSHAVWKVIPQVNTRVPQSLRVLAASGDYPPEVSKELENIQSTVEELENINPQQGLVDSLRDMRLEKNYQEPKWNFYKERLEGVINVDLLKQEYEKKFKNEKKLSIADMEKILLESNEAAKKQVSDISFVEEDRIKHPERYASVDLLEENVELMYDEFNTLKDLIQIQEKTVRAEIQRIQKEIDDSSKITAEDYLATQPELEKEIAEDVQNHRWDYEVPKEEYEKAVKRVEANRKIWYNPHAGAH